MLGYGGDLPLSIKYSGQRMGNTQNIVKGGLLDLVLNIFIGMVTRKGGNACSIQKIGIKRRRIINLSGMENKFGFICGVVGKIWFNAEGDDISAGFQAGFKGNDFKRQGHLIPYPCGEITNISEDTGALGQN